MKISRTLLRTLPLLALLPLSAGLGACSEAADGDGGDGDGDGNSPSGGNTGDGDGASGGNTGDGDGPYRFCSPADTCPPSIEGVDMTTPVSFRNDIYLPYLQGGCGEAAGCHGSAPGAVNLYFGASDVPPLDDAAISALIAQLTTEQAEIAPTQRNVVPGDWRNSFLMAKLDGCQSSYALTCDASNQYLLFSQCEDACGDGMPASEGTSSSPTPFATTAEQRVVIHKIRAWIEQGALDN